MADPGLTPMRRGPLADRAPVSIGLLPAATRFIFRGSAEAAGLCGGSFGCALPLEACRAVESQGRAALWLGPDEWLLLAPEGDGAAELGSAIAQGLGAVPHSLVDISHRQVGLTLLGHNAGDLLNAGCPLDLDLRAFPIGMATRTVLAKADITLWRQAEDRFRIEVNRSFAPYLVAFFREAEAGL